MRDTAGEARTNSCDVLLWSPSRGRASVGRPRTYLKKLCVNIGLNLEDLPGAIDDRDRWRERVREIRTCSVT